MFVYLFILSLRNFACPSSSAYWGRGAALGCIELRLRDVFAERELWLGPSSSDPSTLWYLTYAADRVQYEHYSHWGSTLLLLLILILILPPPPLPLCLCFCCCCCPLAAAPPSYANRVCASVLPDCKVLAWVWPKRGEPKCSSLLQGPARSYGIVT